MALLPASAAYQAALEDLTSIVQDAYNAVSVDDLLEVSDANAAKQTYIKVGSKQAKYDTVMYDFNLAGETLIANDITGYGSVPKVCVSYNSSKTNADVLTKNTPENTDDPTTMYTITVSEFATRTAWKSNFYL